MVALAWLIILTLRLSAAAATPGRATIAGLSQSSFRCDGATSILLLCLLTY
jgi:hypothetical protein